MRTMRGRLKTRGAGTLPAVWRFPIIAGVSRTNRRKELVRQAGDYFTIRLSDLLHTLLCYGGNTHDSLMLPG